MSVDDSPLWLGLRTLPACSEDAYRYVLINQAAFPEHATTIAQLDLFDRHALLEQPLSACNDGATPFLILLPRDVTAAKYQQVLASLCNEACYANAISVMDSSLTLERMADAMTQRCDARLPDGTNVVLRYFDTRIMASLIGVLAQDQLAQFSDCTSAWGYSGRHGPLIECKAKESFSPGPLSNPISFTLAQATALNRATITDGVIDTLLRNNLRAALETPHHMRYALVEGLLEKARSWGLKDRSDLVAYCVIALESGHGFEETMPWSDLLNRVAKHEIDFVDALSIADESIS